MLIQLSLYFSLFAMASQAFAEDWVLRRGSTRNESPQKTGQILSPDTDLHAGSQGLAIETTDIQIMAAPDSRFKIDRTAKEGVVKIKLNEGSLRARVLKKSNSKNLLEIHTRSAVMGVRGTDFLAVYQPLLDESEIVVFTGEVNFASAQNSADAKNVKTGYWGGIGGRYGKKVSDLIRLPVNAIKTFNERSKW